MKLERLVRSGVIAMLFAGAWTMGCGAESPEVPDDDEEDNGGGVGGGGGAFPTGGANPVGGASGVGGTPSGGGAFPTGGASGVGGTPTGGAFPTGGASGAAGTPAGGAGGAPPCGQTAATAADTSIDNLEDGDNTVTLPRIGYWYTYNDMTGCTQTPAPDATGATPFVPTPAAGNAGSVGARTNGMGCTSWGAGLGVDLANCNMKSNPYDASVFNGISFWYKSTTAIRMMVGTLANLPSANGGGCTDSADMCYNHHGMDLAAAPSGMTVTAQFTTLSQAYGTNRPFMKNQILNIQFQASNMVTATGFDITVDDLAFTP